MHMPIEARPVCPHCGGSMLAGHHGELTCFQHGVFFAAATLDDALGAGAAARARTLALGGPQIGRRCPHDRLAMNRVQNASGRVVAEACQRCGSLWLPNDTLDRVVASTPAPPGASPSQAKSLLGFAAARSIVAPAPANAR